MNFIIRSPLSFQHCFGFSVSILRLPDPLPPIRAAVIFTLDPLDKLFFLEEQGFENQDYVSPRAREGCSFFALVLFITELR